MKNQALLESGSYKKLFLNLCIPTIVIMLVMVIYNMADIYFVGKLNDAGMVAALSMSTPLFTILSGIGNVLGSGGCTAIALALGRGENDKVRRYVSFCFYGAIAIGIVFGGLSLIFLEQILHLFGAEAQTYEFMKAYIRIMAIGAPVILFNNVFMNLIRADGSAMAAMVVNLLGTVTNIVLDPIMISGLDMGVSGAALATVIGNGCSVVYLIFYMKKRSDLFAHRIQDFTVRSGVAGEVISLGLPLSISTLLMSVSSIIANKMMIGYGAAAVAANGVAGKAGMLITMLIMGICMGLQPAVSYNYAAGRSSRVKEILVKSTLLTVILGSVLMAACLIFRDNILSAFLNTPEVIRAGRPMVLASVLIGPVYGLYQLCQTYLQSTGKARYAIVVSLLDKGLIYLPVMFLFNAVWGLNGLIFSAFATSILSIIASGLLSLKTIQAPRAIAR